MNYIGSHNIDDIVRAEREKRRKARLLQVRHQSQEIATGLRRAFNAEKDFQLMAIGDKIEKNLTRNKAQQLAIQQKNYSSCVNAIGEGHTRVPIVEKAEHRIADLQEAANHTAKVRGISAWQAQQNKQKAIIECKTKNVQKKQEVRARENERAATIASLPAPQPDSLSKALSERDGTPPVFRNRSKVGAKLGIGANLLPSMTSNVTSSKSPVVPRSYFSKKVDKVQTTEPLTTVNTKKAIPSKRTQLDEQSSPAVTDKFAGGKMDVSFRSQRHGRKLKGYVCKKINRRKSINKRRSSTKSSFTQFSPQKEMDDRCNVQVPSVPKVTMEIQSTYTSDNPTTPFTPTFSTDVLLKEDHTKGFDAQVLAEFDPKKQDLKTKCPEKVEVPLQNVEEYFEVAQEDLHFLQDCENLMKELEANDSLKHHHNKVETRTSLDSPQQERSGIVSPSLFRKLGVDTPLTATEERQRLMEKALEGVIIGVVNKTGAYETSPKEASSYQRLLPADFSAMDGSPHGNETAGILNTCRIEEESVNSSPDMALSRSVIPHLESRRYFPSVFLDDLMLQPAPGSVTTTRRKFDTKKHDNSDGKPQIAITTVIEKDASEDIKCNKSTLKQANSQSPLTKSALKPSEESLLSIHSLNLNPPFLTSSAHQQYVNSQTDIPPVNFQKMPVIHDIANAIQLEPRLVRSTEQLQPNNIFYSSVLRSKSLECVGSVNYKSKTDERLPVPLQSSLNTLPAFTENENMTMPNPQPTVSVAISPEYTHLTPSDTRLALARVLASRKTPLKMPNLDSPSSSTNEKLVNIIPGSADINEADSCRLVNTVTNVHSKSSPNIVVKEPTWSEVFKSSESALIDPLTVAKHTTAIQISDAKVRQCQSELQKIEEEQQELLNELNRLRQSQQETKLDAESAGEDQQHQKHKVLPNMRNNFNTDCQFFVDEQTLSGANSPDNYALNDTSVVQFSPSPEFYVRARPPATLTRGMDRTPHELSTIWEADTPHILPVSSIIEGSKAPVVPKTYFYKTKLQAQTGLSEMTGFPREPFRTAGVSTHSPPLAAVKDSTPLASTPKKTSQLSMLLHEDGPGIMEQSEITLVDSESMSTTGFFTPPDYSPSKLIGMGNLRFPYRRSTSRLVPNSQWPSMDDSPVNDANGVNVPRWQIAREDKLSPLTPQISENYKSESLLSFEKHELSSGSPEGFSPVFQA